MQPQARVRKMRPAGRRRGRKTDGIRRTYYDPDIRAARAAAAHARGDTNDAQDD